MNTKFPHAGQIENTLNQVDPRTGTLEVQARFPNPEDLVLPGQFGRVRFRTKERQGVILVPQRAVQQDQSMQTVYTVGAGNKIEARPVKTGERVGNNWIIEQGLQSGDRWWWRVCCRCGRVFPFGRSRTNRRRARRRA